MGKLRDFPGILLLAGLLGCTTPVPPPHEVKAPELGIIYGHVEAGVRITQVNLREYGKFYFPPFRVPPKVEIYPNGDFIAENLKPGKYYIASYVAVNKQKLSLAAKKYQPYQFVFTVKPGALKYVGSYRITGRYQYDRHADPGDFFLQKVRLPGEREVLRRIYSLTEDTGWQQRIDRRLKELRL
jgi:hypothetical protein